MSQFTAIPYTYACEGNFKAHNTLYVFGTFTAPQLAVIQAKLDSGELFIPTQVGMRALQNELDSFPNEGDHVWHQLDTADFVESAQLPVGQVAFATADEIFRRFSTVVWDVRLEYDRLGLDDIDD